MNDTGLSSYLLSPEDVLAEIGNAGGIYSLLDNGTLDPSQIETGTVKGDEIERLWRRLLVSYKKTCALGDKLLEVLND